MDPSEDIGAVGVLSEYVVGGISTVLAADVIYATEEAIGVVEKPLDVTVSGLVSDEAFPDDNPLLIAQGAVSDSISFYTNAYPFVSDTAHVGGYVDPAPAIDVLTAGFVDEYVTLASASALQSAGALSATLLLENSASVSLTSSGFLSDYLEHGRVFDVSASGALGELASFAALAVTDVTVLGTVGAIEVVHSDVEQLSISSGNLVSSLFAGTDATAVVAVSAWGYGTAEDESGGGAWSANTDNWAASQYTPYGITSLTSFRGGLFGTTGGGLVRVGGDADGSAAIVSRVESHLTDFGDEKLKLPRALYLGYTSNQALTVTMSATDDGQETAYEYFAEPRLAETHVPGRIALGRGLRSRYLRFILANESGGDFAIDSAYIDADVSERRI